MADEEKKPEVKIISGKEKKREEFIKNLNKKQFANTNEMIKANERRIKYEVNAIDAKVGALDTKVGALDAKMDDIMALLTKKQE